MRINKYLAHHTQYSRREADTLIKERKVKINHIEWPKGISMIERRNFIGNASELKRTTKWQSNVSFEEGVDIIVEEFWKEKSC